MIKSVHIVRTLDPRAGGTSACVAALARATEQDGKCISHVYEWRPWEQAKTWITQACKQRSAARESLAKAVFASDVVQSHGLWQSHGLLAMALGKRRAKPLVVSAHGMLEPWALRHKRWKKVPYSALIEGPTLQRASCLHALTRTEANQYRTFGLRPPIAVIPNGIEDAPVLDPNVFRAAFPTLRNKKIVLFLGRIHRKKNVALLCQAWSQVNWQFPDYHLVLAGPAADTAWRDVERQILDLKLSRTITLTGMLHPELKWSALAASEYFVLPSHSEGFSVAVLEALAAGVPPIITPGCNFPEVATAECGWIISPNVEHIASALIEALRQSTAEREKMSLRGRRLARQKYNWQEIGRMYTEIYEWLLGGVKPTCAEMIF
jgi:glycosyltransferase involved in cell wall biosynthesis